MTSMPGRFLRAGQPASYRSAAIIPMNSHLRFESINGHTVFQLNSSLVNWAFQLTQNIQLPDDANLQQVRAMWSGNPKAVLPPFVLEGSSLASDVYWIGDLFNTWAENWVIRNRACMTSSLR
jgi:purine nucleoside permease